MASISEIMAKVQAAHAEMDAVRTELRAVNHRWDEAYKKWNEVKEQALVEFAGHSDLGLTEQQIWKLFGIHRP